MPASLLPAQVESVLSLRGHGPFTLKSSVWEVSFQRDGCKVASEKPWEERKKQVTCCLPLQVAGPTTQNISGNRVPSSGDLAESEERYEVVSWPGVVCGWGAWRWGGEGRNGRIFYKLI